MCGACVHRGSLCTFQSLPGLTRTAALKSEVAQLRTNSSNLLELYRQLRDGSAAEAWNLVEKIRSGQVPIDVPPNANVAQRRISETTPRPTGLVDALDIATTRSSKRMPQPSIASSQGAVQISHFAKRSTVSQRSSSKVKHRDTRTQTHHPVMERNDDQAPSYQLFGQANLSAPVHQVKDCDVSLRLSLLANLDKIHEGFQVQQSCISEIFLCHSEETFEMLMSCLEQDCVDPPKSSILCEICAVAVIAGQYVQDSLLPAVLEQWYSRPEPQFKLTSHSSWADKF